MIVFRRWLASICLVLTCGLFIQSAQAQQTDQAPLLPTFVEVSAEVGMGITHQSALADADNGALMMGGAAAGDFNNDGWQDLFVIGGGERADSLFINLGNGTFQDQAVQAGLANLHVGSGVAVADFDNDDLVDIYVTSFGDPDNLQPGQHRLYRNNGVVNDVLTFTDVAAQAGVNHTTEMVDGFGASFGDYDLDGHLDLFVAGWVLNSKGNRLFHNKGDGTFEDVTDAAGIVDNGIRGFSPCFADMDGDRYPELLLVADFGTSEYFVNQTDGTFALYTTDAAVGKEWSGMGSTVGDFDQDGLLDWYVTAIYDSEGHGRGDGNKLYFNRGEHTFVEQARQAGVDDGGWGWGTVAVDLNLDGWLDLVETNGWPLPVYTDFPAKVWINDGQNLFTDVASSTGFDHRLHGLGMLHLDYDNDGDQDIVVTAPNDRLTLFRNDQPASSANWLRIVLDTGGNDLVAAHGIGSRIRLRAGGRDQYHFMTACSNYLSQSELTAHFGLGAATVVDEIRVEWPDGSVTSMTNLSANQTLTIQPALNEKPHCDRVGIGKNRCVAYLPLLANPFPASGAR